MAVRLIYLRLLPKLIPGIPHATSYFINLDKAGVFLLIFFTNLLARHNRPIAQYFPRPFESTHIVIGDYREAPDLMRSAARTLVGFIKSM
ncbi:hypothetical protein CSPAE12_04448 [Colletotrichum incanum]|nr:hypothetical protein CSPAE12_04448 [Colletotrichum incanum]